MKTRQRIVSILLPIFALACNFGGRDLLIAEDEAQSLLNSTASEGAATVDYLDQFEAANIVGVAALDANTVATNLANRINNNHANCAAAVAVTNVVTVDWGCTLGQGEQAVTIDGTSTVTVTIDAEAVVFTGVSEGLNSNGLSLDSNTVFTVIPGALTATIVRQVNFAKGDDTLSINLNGSAAFDNTDSRQITVNATRVVQLNDLTRTQTWTNVVFEEGKRLPLSGTVNVDGALRDVTAVFSQEADLVTINVTVVNRRGEKSFIFTVDTANGDVVVLQE
jgi:hypothetical protein